MHLWIAIMQSTTHFNLPIALHSCFSHSHILCYFLILVSNRMHFLQYSDWQSSYSSSVSDSEYIVFWIWINPIFSIRYLAFFLGHYGRMVLNNKSESHLSCMRFVLCFISNLRQLLSSIGFLWVWYRMLSIQLLSTLFHLVLACSPFRGKPALSRIPSNIILSVFYRSCVIIGFRLWPVVIRREVGLR